MNRAIQSIILTGALGLLLTSCGSNSGSTQTSGFKRRAFVSNSYSSSIDVIDYSKDQESPFVISGGSSPGSMVLSPDRATTLVLDTLSASIVMIDNKTESALTSVTLPQNASSVVVSSDSKTAWAATRNAAVTGAQTGAVQVIDLTTGAVSTQIAVPLAQTLALSPDGKKLLVFSDQTDTASFIDLTATTPVAVTITGATMSRPVSAVFSSDGTKAYVANCGAECGGTGPAGISVLDMSTNPPTVGTEVPVLTGASTLLLDGSTLYTAGTAPGATSGALTVLSATGSTVSVSKGPIKIGLGFHNKMIKSPDGILFVGATGCPNTITSGSDLTAGKVEGGCLSMYNTSSSDVVITNKADGFVTGMAAIPRRSVVYVVEGGELHIYSTTTRAIQSSQCPGINCFIDILGKAEDVIVIDQ